MRVRLPHPDSPVPKWQEQLVDAMNCQVHEVDGASNIEEKPLGNDTETRIQHTVPLQVKLPRHNQIMYLESREHATALRRLFVSDEWIQKQKGGRLQVGRLLQ